MLIYSYRVLPVLKEKIGAGLKLTKIINTHQYALYIYDGLYLNAHKALVIMTMPAEMRKLYVLTQGPWNESFSNQPVNLEKSL